MRQHGQEEWRETIPYLLLFKENESNHDNVDCIANAWVMEQPGDLGSETENISSTCTVCTCQRCGQLQNTRK